MSDDADLAEHGRLMRALVEAYDAHDKVAEAAAREALRRFNDRRAAESDVEREIITEAFGGDPVVGIELVTGPARERPPYHVDITGKLHGGSFDL